MEEGISLIYRSLRLRRFASTYLPDSPAVRRQTKLYTRVSQDPSLCNPQVALEICPETALQSLRVATRLAHCICAEIFHMNVTHMGQAELSQSWYLGCTSSWCSAQRPDRPSTQRANTPSSGFLRMVICHLAPPTCSVQIRRAPRESRRQFR